MVGMLSGYCSVLLCLQKFKAQFFIAATDTAHCQSIKFSICACLPELQSFSAHSQCNLDVRVSCPARAVIRELIAVNSVECDQV
jgi:hypothetical protein